MAEPRGAAVAVLPMYHLGRTTIVNAPSNSICIPLTYRIVSYRISPPSALFYARLSICNVLYSPSRSLYSFVYRPLIGKSHARACFQRHATQGRRSRVVGCAVQTLRMGEASEHATARGIVARLLATISRPPGISVCIDRSVGRLVGQSSSPARLVTATRARQFPPLVHAIGRYVCRRSIVSLARRPKIAVGLSHKSLLS
jgi:hypothetical protein